MLLTLPVAPVSAQPSAPAPAPAATTDQNEIIGFSADQVSYDSDADVVTASGEVRMNRDGNYLAADQVTWDRKSGQVVAKGNVVIVTPEGDKLVGDNVQLTDTMKDGTVENLMVVLESGGRVAARHGSRANGVMTLTDAIYTPCPVTTETGCPKRPSWAITAARVIDDPKSNRIRFEGGRMQLFGLNIPLLPIFSIGTGTEGTTGWLVPDFSISSRNGFEIAVPYHWQIGPNRDATITPRIYTSVLPAIEGKYRELNSVGAYQVYGFLTYGKIDETDPTKPEPEDKSIRGYFDANGRWQLSPEWTITTSLRAATDKTVTRRYDLTNDDRLR